MHRNGRSLGLAVLPLLPLTLATPASAWGNEGHETVAKIAMKRLTTKTRAKVKALLKPKENLATVATWADIIRPARKDTAAWHFVDIPVGKTYDAARDCVAGACVIRAIDRYRAVLGDATKPKPERYEALKFVVHFVGDLHQPLHCATGLDANGKSDRGGNEITVRFLKVNTSLHHTWDVNLLTSNGLTEDEYVAELVSELASADTAALLTGTPAEWASEAHRLAETNAYDLAADHHLPQSYVDTNHPVVSQQLTKAGVRLAQILNETLQ